MTRASAFLALALLAGCGQGSDQGVGGVTADEAAQLNNAAEMLDASPDGLAAPDNAPLDTESNRIDTGANGT